MVNKIRYSKKAIFYSGLFSISLLSCTHEDQPNIILFVVDDMGWTDTSVPFYSLETPNNQYLNTPNMEWLASKGMKFTNAYAASPVSSPTRSSLLTGMNPARSHITNWIVGEGEQSADINTHLIPNWNSDGVNSTNNPLPMVLKANGYQTAHIGKAHFGKKGTEGANPLNLGFDYNIGGHHKGHPASYYVPYGKEDSDAKVPHLEQFYADSLYLTDALTFKALELIEKMASQKDEKPFFLNMAHYAVHTPIQGDMSLIEKYEREDKNKFAQQYATMIESMDKSLGDIVKKLQELGIDDNTIILFMSDNGGLVAHSGPPTTNFPLSSGKGSSHEGGTRVPMIVYWPGVVQGNTICDEPVISDDFYPTVLKMAKIKSIKEYTVNIDGKDISGLLKQTGDFERNDAIYWHYPHYWANLEMRQADTTIHPYSAIRDGDWKLIYNYNNEFVELYNLMEDIGEATNLSKAEPEKAKDFCHKLSAYLRKVDAQLPINRVTNKEVPYPHF